MTKHATPQEIMNAFATMTEKEKRALHAVAKNQLGGTDFSSALDLVYEALSLAISGRRRWPLKVKFVIFMMLTVRSVAYANRTMSANTKTVGISSDDVLEWIDVDSGPSHPSAEDCVERNQEIGRKWEEVLSAHNALEHRDPLAARVLDKIVAEKTTVEIRRELGLCVAELDAAKKRVLRALRNSARL